LKARNKKQRLKVEVDCGAAGRGRQDHQRTPKQIQPLTQKFRAVLGDQPNVTAMNKIGEMEKTLPNGLQTPETPL
jgi:hypothetical protein